MKILPHSSSAPDATASASFGAPALNADAAASRPAPRARTLSIDVGGTTLKAAVLDARGKMVADRVTIDTPYPCPPKVLVNTLVGLVQPLLAYDRVSIGFPGYVRGNSVITAPHFGDARWHGFDLAGALQARLGRPVRLLNDADMQGLAAIRGRGLELVVTLGTGVGTALFRDGELMPHLELAHHPVHKDKDYNAYLGNKALEKAGKRKWNRRLQRVLKILRALFHFDRVYLGGGNSRRITFKPGADTRIISNDDGILGGFHLWVPLRPSRANGRASHLAPVPPGRAPRRRSRARGMPAAD